MLCKPYRVKKLARRFHDFDSNRGIGLDHRAGAAGLDQVLLLVVVDVKVIEHVDRTALVSTDIVVVQVDDDAGQLTGLALAIRTSQTSITGTVTISLTRSLVRSFSSVS